MKFTKMQGCGNDYIYVNCFEETVHNPETLAKRVSDRHFGIGADGLILICPPTKETADVCMRMYNADGSEGSMCGNGIRCVAKYAYEHHLVNRPNLIVETKSGLKELQLQIRDGIVEQVTVQMGHPIFRASEIPVALEQETVIRQPILVDGISYEVTCISMGNPHAVVFVENVDDVNLEKIGPLFESHTWFPDRINTEFVQEIGKNVIRMRVWERGSGETLACGTGACASAVAYLLKNGMKNQTTVEVQLRGGTLKISYDSEKNCIEMTGPAKEVFSGEIKEEIEGIM